MFVVINMFGMLKSEVQAFLEEQNISYDGLLVDVKEKHYETYVTIEATEEKKDVFEHLQESIMTVFSKNIYGTNEQNIYSCAFELLKEQGKKLAIAESVTAGRLCSEFVANNEGASKILIEGIVCYSVKSKCNIFGIEPEFFQTNSPQSAETSQLLAQNLMRISGADVVIATTGYASNDINDSDNGNAYIAVGLESGIFTQRVRFLGTRNHIMQQISKFAFMFLIKMLKQYE